MRRLLRLALALTFLAALAAAWRLAPPAGPPVAAPGFVLEDVTVVNPGAGRLPHRTLTAAGGLVESISPAAGTDGAFAGRFVLPGLIDVHVHHPPAVAFGERELFALLFLAHGVTSVRDVGVTAGSLTGLRRRLAEGRLVGPRLFTCERILDGEPPGWPSARVVHGPEEARAAVRESAAEGADCVKLYNQLDRAGVQAAREEAAARGLPVVAHVGWNVALEDFESAEIQHLMGLTESWGTLTDARIAEYVRTSVSNRLSHTPTLVTFVHAAHLFAGDSGGDAAARLLPPHYRELFWNPAHNPLVLALAPEGGEQSAARPAAMARAVRALHAVGVPILAGTDTLNPFVVPGAALIEELGLLAEAGLGPEEALAAATLRAGRALGVPGLGILAPGSPADLIVLRKDPTVDLSALATLEAVAVGGRLYPRAALDAAIEARRRHFESPDVRAAWRGASRFVLGLLRDL